MACLKRFTGSLTGTKKIFFSMNNMIVSGALAVVGITYLFHVFIAHHVNREIWVVTYYLLPG